jgi:hypothetical protein
MTINKITYLDQFYTSGIFMISDPYIDHLKYFDYLELTKFLNKLEHDKVYVITFEYVYSWLLHDDNDPVIKISKPILITKNSDPRIISNFLKEKVELIIDLYYLDDQIIQSLGEDDSPSIIVRYKDIRIF